MDASSMLWVGGIVAVLVFLDLLFVELRRAFREGKRVMRRLAAYGELPILSLLATSEHDVERIIRALDAVQPLIERAERAIGVVRRYIPKGSSPG
jgi:putative copper export protein